MNENKQCVFCEIIANEHGANFGGAFLLKPLNPVTDGHMLVMPTSHVEHAFQQPALTAKVWAVAEQHGQFMRQFGVTDFNLIMSIGSAATQTIKHLHIHVVPRREGDGLHLPWTNQVIKAPEAQQ